MKWKDKKRKWELRNCKKGNKKRKHSKRLYSSAMRTAKNYEDGNYKKYVTKDIDVLSIYDNTEETYEYFNDIIDEIRKKNYKEQFFFNLMNVKKISIDAIMYILAILRNIKDSSVYRYRFSGNQPINKDANDLFIKSGFFDYVRTRNVFMKTDSDNMQIKTGDIVNAEVAKNISDFINVNCGTSKLFTAELYEMIIELMTNTVQHAYSDSKILVTNQWYIFVGNEEKHFTFVFLDTGVGIPQTVNKKAREKFGDLMTKNKDSYYLESALMGEWRSSTAESYRGKGLPSIVEYTKRPEVSHCRIYSGHGMCKIDKKKEKSILPVNYGNKLFGTLIYCRIEKNKIGDEYYE